MSRSSSNFIYYIFPKRCLVCDAVICADEFLCMNCRDTIKEIEVKTCKRCGNMKSKCQCNKYVYHFRGAVAPFANEGNAKVAIYNFKFLPNAAAAEFFAKPMADRFRTTFGDVNIDCVTSVPMTLTKKIGNCFDHSARLARCVAKELGVPYKSLLVDKGERSPQHELKAKERFMNVKNSYKAKKNNYTNILLIDDIKTTGATLDECSRQLMLSGAENIYAATGVISP